MNRMRILSSAVFFVCMSMLAPWVYLRSEYRHEYPELEIALVAGMFACMLGMFYIGMYSEARDKRVELENQS